MSKARGAGNQPGDEQVHANPVEGRYELSTPQGIAFAEYRPAGGALLFTHTEVPEELEGQGIGSKLVRGALDDVRARGQLIIPACPFVAAYISRHPEYSDLLAPEGQGV